MAQIFQARYAEHNAQLTSQFMKWYRNGTYVDVTIHAGGERILAHKVVLAANSPFFNGVFMDTKKEMTHLYFTDVPFESMKSLIEYMYCGTLVVEREFAAACLQLGDSLRVKGISDATMEDVIKEPLPVTDKMYSFINAVINQCCAPAEYIKQTEQELNYKDLAVEERTLPENSMLDFTKNEKANSYNLQQTCHTTTEEQITSTGNAQKMHKLKLKKKAKKRKEIYNVPKFDQNQNQVAENCSQSDQPTMEMIEKTEDYFQRIPIEDENQLWVDTRNATKIPDHNDENKFNTNLFQNNDVYLPDLPLESHDAFERSCSKVEISYQNFDPIEASNLAPKPNKFVSKKRNALKREINKKAKKQKAKRNPTKVVQHYKDLFGDSYLSKNNNEMNENDKTGCQYVQKSPKEDYEQNVLNGASETIDLEKTNVKRQDSAPCPPPEDIFKDGKISFACSLCHKIYTHKSNYRRHYMVFHKRSAEPVFECSMCTKKFTRSDNRAHHLRKIHGLSNPTSINNEETLINCPICKKVFTYSSNRAIHMKEMHGIGPETTNPEYF